jgi:hypothetical protein
MKGDAALVSAEPHAHVVAAVVKWSHEFIEQPHDVFGGLPVCPFAKAARLKDTIRFEVHSFAMGDPLDTDGDIMVLVRDFAQQARSGAIETLFVVHPDRAEGVRDLEAFVQRLNERLAAGELRELQAFEAHPESNFSVGGVYTRRSPYPSFQILSRRLLKNGSDSLLGSSYYEHFTPDMLRAVGMPRP